MTYVRRWVGAIALVAVLGACGAPEDPGDANRMTAPMSAAEVAREMEVAKDRTPLPPGVGWQPINLDPTASYGRGSGRTMIEFQAACAWFGYASEASREGDGRKLDLALSVVRAVPTWETFADPALADVTLRTLVSGAIADAFRGDFTAIDTFRKNNCT